MPILKREQDVWPESLLETGCAGLPVGGWWAMYTLPRFEKKLMRQLVELNVAFYGPTIERRYRSPQGRVCRSYEPLFPNYVFVHGTESERYRAMKSGSVSRCLEIPNGDELIDDLRKIYALIKTGQPVIPENAIEPGQSVRIKSGIFKAFEGVVVRRESELRLMISVRYMGRGASVLLDECQVEPIG